MQVAMFLNNHFFVNKCKTKWQQQKDLDVQNETTAKVSHIKT